jgi:hypothetical protein
MSGSPGAGSASRPARCQYGRVSVRVGRNSKSGRADLKGLDAGGVRHPLYGNRKRWYTQAVAPGSISEGISEEGADALERAVEIAADRAVERILRAF